MPESKRVTEPSRERTVIRNERKSLAAKVTFPPVVDTPTDSEKEILGFNNAGVGVGVAVGLGSGLFLDQIT